ncbi:MAG TPA: response regulator [Polyangiaceae bacterium]|nr:response regulator [Polyangiaceae bacterium]
MSRSNRLASLARLGAKGGPAEKEPKPAILVVDDNPLVRAGLELTLKDEFDAVLCGSGREALARLNERLEAAVLDVKMPEMDGFEVYRRIRERLPELPVVFYSAYQDFKEPLDVINEYAPAGFVIKGREDAHEKLLDVLRRCVRIGRSKRQVDRLRKEMSRVFDKGST